MSGLVSMMHMSRSRGRHLHSHQQPAVTTAFIDGAGYMGCHCHPSVLGGMTPEEIGGRVEDRRPGSEFDGSKL